VGTFGVRQNITLASLDTVSPGRLLRIPSARRERVMAAELMQRLSVTATGPDQNVLTLSGGNQQKVVLARWLMREPQVLIFDEPTAGIDVGAKEEIFALMAGLAAAGKSIIFITSELEELNGVCDRVLVMYEGAVVAELEGSQATESAILHRCYGDDAERARMQAAGAVAATIPSIDR
jgi:ABC-type sugar transport system ATPase subunit